MYKVCESCIDFGSFLSNYSSVPSWRQSKYDRENRPRRIPRKIMDRNNFKKYDALKENIFEFLAMGRSELNLLTQN